MKYKELEKKSVKELGSMENQLREELFHLRLKNRTGQLEKRHQIRAVRRDIARVKTRMASLVKAQASS